MSKRDAIYIVCDDENLNRECFWALTDAVDYLISCLPVSGINAKLVEEYNSGNINMLTFFDRYEYERGLCIRSIALSEVK